MIFSCSYIDVDYRGILNSVAPDVLDINMNTLLPYLQGHHLVTLDEEYHILEIQDTLHKKNLKPL